jgi:Carbohydrate-binding module 48 (Isoamylase N-terminal domain)
MFEHQPDIVERAIDDLRRPVRIDPALDARVMQAIARLPVPGSGGAVAAAWRWLTRPRQLAVSPLLGLAAAAGLVLLAAFPTRRWVAARAGNASREFQFVLVAPKAATVTLVGDFNDWDARRTPMRRARSSAVWTTVIPLPPGRYRYAFLVNNSQWVADPAAPRVLDDEFNPASSVVTVGGS